MNRIGIKIDLDTSDLVSSAGRARQSIAGLTEEMKKAQKEGRNEDYVKLSFEKDRLQGRTSGFERDIKTLTNDPRFQTQSAAGDTVFKIDPEYADAIKSQTEAIRKLTDEYQGAIHSGNVEKIRELTPQIEKQQSFFHKTVNDITSTNGNIPQEQPLEHNAPGLKNPYIPLLPNNEDWQKLNGLSGAITQEHDAGNWKQVANLGGTKDTLRGIMGEYDRDSNLEAKLKADPEFSSQLKEIRDALKGTIAALNEAAVNGDYQKVEQLTGQAKQLQGISHKTIEEAAALNPQLQGSQAAAALAQTFSADRIVSAITSGVSSAVGYANQAGIVNKLGGGDAIGAQIEGARKEGDLVGGISKTVLTAIGGIVGNLIVPGVGGVAAGALVGGGVGDLIKSLGFDLGANVKETEEAHAQQWQQQAPGAMQLGAILGIYGGSMDENTRSLRTAFDRAARAANEFGFSAEEGIETIKQAAMQGLDYDESLAAARNIYGFERGIGADRGTLTSVETQMMRYGQKDALGVAWQGNQASGLETGQYSEFLRSMQRIFEDGISKGFVRGAKEISETLTFLSDLNNDSELWKGEQGANRLSQMNSSVEQTTSLASTTDILAYRGAQNVLKGFSSDDWKSLLDVDKNGTEDIIRGRGSSEYINAMMVLERGLTPELFNEQMKMFNTAEKGDYVSVIERMRQAYGLDYTQSAQLYKSWEQNKNNSAYFDSDTFARELEKYSQKPPENNNAELAMFKDVETIRTKVSEIGMYYTDKRAPEIKTIVVEVTREADKTPTGIQSVETSPNGAETGGTDNAGGQYFPSEMPEKTINDLMGGTEDMPVFTDRGAGPSFNDRLEAAGNAAPASAEHKAYLGLQKHFSGLMYNDIERAQQLNFYPSIWHNSDGDITKFWDTIQHSGGVPDVNREEALSGFFDKRGDQGFLKGLGSFFHVGNNDNTSLDRLDDLEIKTPVGTNDYNLLMRSYGQLAAFNPQQRETIDRDNSLNQILHDNNLTAQKLYDAVVELARQMGVRIVYE